MDYPLTKFTKKELKESIKKHLSPYKIPLSKLKKSELVDLYNKFRISGEIKILPKSKTPERMEKLRKQRLIEEKLRYETLPFEVRRRV